MADIYFLLKDGLDLRRAFMDADSKAAGITPLLAAKVLLEFDYRLLDKEIRWVRKIPSRTVAHTLKTYRAGSSPENYSRPPEEYYFCNGSVTDVFAVVHRT